MLASVICFAGFGVWYLVVNQSEEAKDHAVGVPPKDAKSTIQVSVDAVKIPAPYYSKSDVDPTTVQKYTAYEKEHRLRAINEIYGVFVDTLTPAYIVGRDLVNNLRVEVAQGTAAKNLREQYNRTETAFNTLNASLKKYGYLSGIVEAAKKNNFDGKSRTGGL